VFYGIDKEACILYVPNSPATVLSQYQTTNGWKAFTNIITTDLTIRADVNRDNKVNATDVVSIYNYIIQGTNSGISTNQADVNSDQKVNAADVVAVYNYIITGK